MPHWWFPANASSYGQDIDRLFLIILYITGAVFLLVEIGLMVFLVKYRSRAGHKASYIEGSTRAEIIWTAIPAIIVICLGVFSQPLWSRIKDPDRIPADAISYTVLGKQFEWHIGYPGPDGRLDTEDDFQKRNELHLIVNRPYALRMTAEDVIHSLFIPAFRFKQDVVPGMLIRGWIQATRTGEFEIACAELCGLGHYRMRARVFVHTAEEFAAWQAGQGIAPAAAPDSTPSSTGANR